MPDQSPRLAVVSDKPWVSPDAGGIAAPDRRGRTPLIWLLAGGFAVCALGWLFQARETRELAASLEVTRTALGRAQAELRAYDEHLTEIHDRQLDSLQALVEAGPRHPQEP